MTFGASGRAAIAARSPRSARATRTPARSRLPAASGDEKRDFRFNALEDGQGRCDAQDGIAINLLAKLEELHAAMPAHRDRVMRLLEMHRDMMGNMKM